MKLRRLEERSNEFLFPTNACLHLSSRPAGAREQVIAELANDESHVEHTDHQARPSREHKLTSAHIYSSALNVPTRCPMIRTLQIERRS